MKIPVIYIIKVVKVNMNPVFTKVILNSFIFVVDIFCAGATRKFGIIGIITRHQASFCLINTQQLSGE